MQQEKTNRELEGNVITLDIEDRFNAAKLNLSALLDALQCVIIAGRADDKHGETAYALTDMAEDCMNEIEGIFEEIPGKKRNGEENAAR